MDNKKQIPFSLAQKKLGKYINPYEGSLRRSLFHFLLWQFGYYKDRKKTLPPPQNFTYPKPSHPIEEDKPQVTWIGHSSFLIDVGVKILTDPVFSNCCAPVSFCGPKRRCKLPFKVGGLPAIDLVVLSHNHYDHLDEKGIIKIAKNNPNCKWIVPSGLKKWFLKRNITDCLELSWGDSALFSHDLKITSVPSQHFSGRGLFDKNKTLWSGYVIESKKLDKKIYFAGDTGYNPHDFKAIGEFWKGFDLSLLPIGSYLPRKFMRPVHVNPHEAVKIHEEVYSKKSIGMHWNSFCLSEEPMTRPPYDLFLEMQKKNLDFSLFFVLEPGETTNF